MCGVNENFGAAFVLAGGRSHRMSFDKQTIKINGRFIAEFIADQLSVEFSDIFIISNNKGLYEDGKYKVITDEVVGCGPLGGLYTALCNTKSEYAYITGCDMPFVNLEYIRFMKEQLQGQGKPHDGVLTTTNGLVEPLNAFYHKRLMDLIPPLLAGGKRRMAAIYEEKDIIYVPEDIMAGFDPGYLMFFNLNTLEDYSRITGRAVFSADNLCSRSLLKCRDI